jgi:hypothetical protein
MNDGLDKTRLGEAFAALGNRLQRPTRLLIGGAGALISRMHSLPAFGRLQVMVLQANCHA